jgi:hypothetical protein
VSKRLQKAVAIDPPDRLARAAAHQRRRGRCDLADRVGRIAGMIHLPASVRVSVSARVAAGSAAEESVWSRSTLCAERPVQP